ncbi:MAG: hypothetical protein HRS50_01960 [Mycoplasmataceae bacterium]|nr:hypothetical protein [Mycoplasmataceae bacterium]
MRTLIFVIAGIFSGYIITNLKTKKIEEIFENLLKKTDDWIEVIQKFIGDTVNDIEGLDSDAIKMNIDSFINGLTNLMEEFLEIESFEEKVKLVEEKIAKISFDLIDKIEK